MGAKSAIIMYADKPPREYLHGQLAPDESAARTLATKAFPNAKLTAVGESDLSEEARPASGLVYAARFPGVDVLTCERFMVDHPNRLPDELLELAHGRAMYIHFQHSVVDWLAFGEYRQGRWLRLLSLAPDTGVLEDLGPRLDCETPYWAGNRPVDDEYPLPFHPLDLAETVMAETLGFTLEGIATDLLPESIPVHGFRIGDGGGKPGGDHPHT